MIKISLISLTILFSCFVQTFGNPADKTGKWYYGGNAGISKNNDYLRISFEPLIGYNISSKFSSGVKAHYSYIKYDNDASDLSYNNYGGSVFARYSPIPNGYLHSEFAYENYDKYVYNSGTQKYENSRVWVPFFLVGAGYKQPIGSNASLYAEVLVDVIRDKNSPFKKWEPIFNVGATVGF
jgi:hypothetical protein